MKYYTDGFTINKNPSNKGGYTVYREDGDIFVRNITKNNFTNNEAELLGILEGAKRCEMYDELSTDSMCMIYWIRRGKSKSRPDLNILIKETKHLIESKFIDLIWQCRDENLAGIYNEHILKV